MSLFIFDLDNTLYSRDDAFERFVTSRLGELRPDEWTSLVELDCGGHGSRRALTASLSKLAATRDLSWSADAVWEDMRRGLGDFARLPHGSREFLENLRDRHELAIITNGSSKNQRRKLQRLGLATAVDHILVSEEFGTSKPDAAIFEACLAHFDCAPRHATMVGDHPRQDIRPAKALGLRTCWIQNERIWDTAWGDAPDLVSASPASLPIDGATAWT